MRKISIAISVLVVLMLSSGIASAYMGGWNGAVRTPMGNRGGFGCSGIGMMNSYSRGPCPMMGGAGYYGYEPQVSSTDLISEDDAREIATELATDLSWTLEDKVTATNKYYQFYASSGGKVVAQITVDSYTGLVDLTIIPF